MIYRLVIFSFLFAQSAWAEMKVYATTDQNRIVLNETLSLKVTAEESNDFPKLDISAIKDFTVISGPGQSSSFQWVNGKMSSSKTLSWTLIPNKPGSLTIPALTVEIDGKLMQTEPIVVTVLQSDNRSTPNSGDQPSQKEPQAPLIFLLAEPDKKEVFQGEQVTIHYKLYTRVNLRQYAVESKPQGVGFWQEELYAPKQPTLRETSVDGVRYRIATLYKVALFPTTHGNLTLEPMILNCSVEIPSRNRKFSLFDDFFSDPFFSRTKQQNVRSDKLTFNVKPVPEVGKSADYTGAVGDFRLTSSVDTASVAANQALAFTVELSGTGNLGLFQLPEPEFPGGLEVFSPKTSMDKDPFRDEISGKRSWEYILIPRREGQVILPSVGLIYLEPKTGKWLTTETDPIPVLVTPAVSAITESSGLTKEEIALLSQDIRYIRQDPVRIRSISNRIVPRTFWLMNLLAVAMFFAPNVVELVQSNRVERQGAIRVRGTLRRAKKILLKVGDNDYEKVEQAIYSYFSDRMGLPGVGLDGRILEQKLQGAVDKYTVEKLSALLDICDMGQFSPSVSDTSASELAYRAVDLLREIERQL